MIRKLILSAVIATATLTGLSTTPTTAEAAAPFNHEFNHHRFEVLVRCGHAWEQRGTYRDRDDAERAARHLRHQGFDVRIERC